ncbi:MAG TPA: glycosyl transferase, partial [Candidatus Competibacter phosphatis]|nr:glycosyl transferase [Candidatus Competibacter phosphatis]
MRAALSKSARLFGGQVLTNGRYATLLTASGTGCSLLGELALTRWHADPLEDGDGFFLYLRDLDSGAFWSLGQQPAAGTAERRSGRFGPALTELLCRHEEIDACLEACVPADIDGELRRVTLRNLGDRPRRIELTSYTEVVLNDWAADAAHPAFSKLFVQTEWVADTRALLARRRPRVPNEPECWLVHALTGEADHAESPHYETDRALFIGRGYTLAAPRALVESAPLSGTVGKVLDPIVCLRRTVELAPGGEACLTFLLGATATREQTLALVAHHASAAAVEQAFRAASGGPTEPVSTRRIAAQTVVSPPAFPTVTAAELPFDEEPLQFWNGHGGFSADGTEYVIRLQPEANGRLRLPPQPWTNVIANPGFGFIASETGAGCTWSQNSRENRLTPWYNDPVLDPHGEA